MISCGDLWLDQSSTEYAPVADHHVMEWMGATVQHVTWTASSSLTPPPDCQAPLPQSHWPWGSVCSVFWCLLPSAHNSIQDSTAHHRLRKHPEHSPAEVLGPQPSQTIEMTLSLSVEGVGVLYLVQFIISVDPQILKILHNVHTDLWMETGANSTLVLFRSSSSSHSS